jgi:hypothetical protein
MKDVTLLVMDKLINLTNEIQTLIAKNKNTEDTLSEKDILKSDVVLSFISKENDINNSIINVEKEITDLSFFFERIYKIEEVFNVIRNYYIALDRSKNMTQEDLNNLMNEIEEQDDSIDDLNVYDGDEDVEIGDIDLKEAEELNEQYIKEFIESDIKDSI